MAQGDNFPIDANGGFRTILPPEQRPGQVAPPEQVNPLEEAAEEIQDDQEVTRQEDRVTLTGENQIGVRTPRPGQTEATAENANNFRIPRSGEVVEAGPAEPSPVERANDEIEAQFAARETAAPPADENLAEDPQTANAVNQGAAARVENPPPEADAGNAVESRAAEAVQPPPAREAVAAERPERPEPEVREASNRENIEAAAQAGAAERNNANEERTEAEDVQRQENVNPTARQTQVGQNVDRLI